MSRQMLRNATRLPGVVSGRFDFKGTASIGVGIEAFSAPLGIDPPTGGTLNERLASIFTELRRRAQPTLLVFDTYEAAGEAKDWIESVLLPHPSPPAAGSALSLLGNPCPPGPGPLEDSGEHAHLQFRAQDWLGRPDKSR